MDIDQPLRIFQTAVLCAVDKGTNKVDEKQLIKNVCDSFIRVTRLSSQPDKKVILDKFCLKSTATLLLCCPVVRNVRIITECKDFASIFHSFPELSSEIFFNVVKSLRSYKYVASVLQWLPSGAVMSLFIDYFDLNTGMNPSSYILSQEMVYAFVYAIKREDNSMLDLHSECFSGLVNFFDSGSFPLIGNKDRVIIIGYWLLYLIRCINIFLKSLTPNFIPVVKKSGLSILDSSDNLQAQPLSEKHKDAFLKCILELLTLCKDNLDSLSVDYWMELNEVMVPEEVLHSLCKTEQLSLQSAVSHAAFECANLLEEHSVNGPICLSAFGPVLQFFEQIKSDPEHDPDVDLPLCDLIKKFEETPNVEKLLHVVLNHPSLLESSEAILCVKSHAKKIRADASLELLLRFITTLEDGCVYLDGSKEAVLEVAQNIPGSEILKIIKDKLSSGLDEKLKSSNFENYSTFVFNQMAHHDYSLNSNLFIWLCLQSSRDALKQAVSAALGLSGIVNVMANAIVSVSDICLTKSPDGTSLLGQILKDKLRSGLASKVHKDYIELVAGVLGEDKALLPKEVLEILIVPHMELMENNTLPQCLEAVHLPLQLLEIIAVGHMSLLMSLDSRELAALLIFVLYIVHYTADLQMEHSLLCLSARSQAVRILKSLIPAVAQEETVVENVLPVLNCHLEKFEFHCRCQVLLIPLIGIRKDGLTLQESLLCTIMQDSDAGDEQYLQSKHELRTVADFREKWIWALYDCLSDCSSEEWLKAFLLTRTYLCQDEEKNFLKVCETFDVIQLVIHLYCLRYTSKDRVLDDCQKHSVYLHHIFKSFSSAALEFTKLQFVGLNAKEKIRHIVELCCRATEYIPLYECDPDLASLLLANLVSYLDDVIRSSDFRIVDSGKNVSHMNGEEKGKKKKKCKKSRALQGSNLSCAPVEEPHRKSLDASDSAPLSEPGANGDTHQDAPHDPGSATESCQGKDNNALSSQNSIVELQVGGGVSSSHLLKEEYIGYINKVCLCVIRHVSVCNIVSSTASKLKGLLEIVQCN